MVYAVMWMQVRCGIDEDAMPYVGCPLDVSVPCPNVSSCPSVPCPSCVQAQLLISVLRQGMHPVCVDGSRSGPQTPPHYDCTTPQLQVFFIGNVLLFME